MAYQLIANAPPIPVIDATGAAMSFTGGVGSTFDLAAAVAPFLPTNETVQGVSTTPALLTGLTAALSPLRVVYDGVGTAGALGTTDFLVRTQNYVIRYRVPSVTITSSLTAPQNLVASGGVVGANEDPVGVLTWSAVAGAADYLVYRSLTDVDANYVLVAPVGPAPGYSDPGVSHSVTYFWKVAARTAGGAVGPRSASATAKMVPGFTSALTPPSFTDGISSDYAFPVSEPNVVVAALDNILPAALTLPAVTPPVLRFTNTGATETYGPTNFRFRVLSNAAGDLATRAAAPGVISLNQFRNQAQDVDRYLLQNGSFNAAGRTGLTPTNGVTYAVMSSRGVTGDGCLRISVPLGGGDRGRWTRPLGPLVGDINQPGLQTVGTLGASTQAMMAFWQGPQNNYVAHSSYQIVNPRQAQDGAFKYIGTEIYYQYWLRLSPGRLSSSPQMPISKMIWLELSNSSPMQELVMNIGGYGLPPNDSNSAAPNIAYWYTGKGVRPDALMGPNNAYQPGAAAPYDTACVYPLSVNPGQPSVNRCIWIRENEWMNFRVRIRPGRHNVAETLVTCEVAFLEDLAAGTYRTLLNLPTAVWQYDTNPYDSSNNGFHPNGLNMFSINMFTGGGDITPAPQAYWVEVDQVLISTLPPACPRAMPLA